MSVNKPDTFNSRFIPVLTLQWKTKAQRADIIVFKIKVSSSFVAERKIDLNRCMGTHSHMESDSDSGIASDQIATDRQVTPLKLLESSYLGGLLTVTQSHYSGANSSIYLI